MKRNLILISALLAIAMLSTPAFAAKTAQWKTLDDADGTVLTNYALTVNNTVYSEPILIKNNTGFSTIIITEDKSGGAGDVDLSVEYSIDGVVFGPAYLTPATMDGTITVEADIVTALGNTTTPRWIPHPVRLSRFMRYKFDPDADSQITVKHIFQNEN